MATIRLMTSNSVRGVLDEALPRFERATGHKVAVSYDPAKVMLRRIRGGETGDLALLSSGAIDELIKEGRLAAATRRELARCGVGVGVRAGARKPDIGTVDAFKKAMLEAKSIAHTVEGASGMHFAGLIERLGIAPQVKAKAKTQGGGLVGEIVARGDAELAIQQIPELLAVPGIELAGPLPAEIQVISVSVATLFTGAAEPAAAQQLIDYLATPEAAKVYRAKGHEPVAA